MFIHLMTIWNILWRFGIFYDHLVHFIFIWYIFQVLVTCTKKNLATLLSKADKIGIFCLLPMFLCSNGLLLKMKFEHGRTGELTKVLLCTPKEVFFAQM
jgi:hypothetical protein